MRTFTCGMHNRIVEITPETTGCPDCNAFLDDPPDPVSMSGQERVAELTHWFGVLTVKFERLHPRIEALVGRPVWTHEMASSNIASLFAEAESWDHPADPFAHAMESLSDVVGAENVYVYPEAP